MPCWNEAICREIVYGHGNCYYYHYYYFIFSHIIFSLTAMTLGIEPLILAFDYLYKCYALPLRQGGIVSELW